MRGSIRKHQGSGPTRVTVVDAVTKTPALVVRFCVGSILEWHEYLLRDNLSNKAPLWWIDDIVSGASHPYPDGSVGQILAMKVSTATSVSTGVDAESLASLRNPQDAPRGPRCGVT